MEMRGGHVLTTKLCLFAALALISCAEPVEPDDDWKIKQDYEPLELGYYDIEVEILEDGCEPSLKTIVEASPEWPNKRTYVSGSPAYEYEMQRYPATLSVYAPHLRTGDVLITLLPLSDDWRPLGKSDALSAGGANFDLACQGEIHLGKDFDISIESLPNKDGSFRLVYTTEWLTDNPCTTVEGATREEDAREFQERWTWRPESACRESFAVDFKLTQAYPRPGNACDPIGSIGSGTLEDGTNTFLFPELNGRDIEDCDLSQ